MNKNAFDLKIDHIAFRDGTHLKLDPESIVLVVGANNAGKTTFLTDISQYLEGSTHDSPVVHSIGFSCQNAESIAAWIEAHIAYTISDGSRKKIFSWMTHLVLADQLPRNLPKAWVADSSGKGIGRAWAFFCSLFTVTDRATVCRSKKAYDPLVGTPKEPMHLLAGNEQLEEYIRRESKRVFGRDLIVDRGMCESIEAKWGTKPDFTEGEDRASLSYRKKLSQLPSLAAQGHGVQGFVGALMLVGASVTFIRLLDEPELFLHPPHARRLGQVLAEPRALRQGQRYQLLMATHSSDFLKGVVEAGNERVTIIRLSRNGDLTRVHQLSSADAAAAVSNPILRHSNVLDGVFHELAVVCEGDSDCRFFSALLDAAPTGTQDVWPRDTHFSWCGGKDRAPVLVNALHKLGVDTRVVLDLDALNDESLMERLVTAIGASWPTIKPAYQRAINNLPKTLGAMSMGELRDALANLLKRHEKDRALTEDCSRELKDLSKYESQWAVIKRSGLASLPSGEPQVAMADLLRALGGLGIWLVPVGEIERFVPTIGGHGPAWVATVIEKCDLANGPELQAAREFIKRVIEPN